MKLLRACLAALMIFGLSPAARAQDVYVCHVVLFCNDNGQCVEIEICDVVEEGISSGIRLGGGVDAGRGILTLRGLPREMNGQSVTIRSGATLAAPKGVKPIEGLVGKRLVPGKYPVSGGTLSLKIGDG